MFEPRTLRYFIATAEDLHMGQASKRLGIAQPALSQQILALEARLGLQLFIRANRRIRLTEAGKVFLVEARHVVAASERAIRLARDASRGVAGELHIGYSASAIFEPLLSQLLRRFRKTYPQVALVLHEASVKEQLNGLRAERLDIAFLRGPLDLESDEFAVQVYLKSKLRLALAADHPLAKKAKLSLNAIKDDPFITFPDPPGMGLGHSHRLLFSDYGIMPDLMLQAGDVMSVLALVGAGLGVSIVPELPQPFLMSSVVLRPFTKTDAYTEVLMATRKLVTQESLTRFVDLATDVIGVQGDEAKQP